MPPFIFFIFYFEKKGYKNVTNCNSYAYIYRIGKIEKGMVQNLIADTENGVGGLIDYAPYILILGIVAIIVVAISILTGSYNQIASDISASFWPVIGIMVFVIGALYTFEVIKKDRKPEREKAVLISLGILVLLMIVLFNLPQIVHTAATSVQKALGIATHQSGLTFPVQVKYDGFSIFYSYIAITFVSSPTVIANTPPLFAIPPLGITSNSDTLNVAAYCNNTVNIAAVPGVLSDGQLYIPSDYSLVSNASTTFSVSSISLSGKGIIPITIYNIPDNGQCFYFFTLTGPGAVITPYQYSYTISGY